MRSALGIDAAWTRTQPSGVALAGETDAGWRLVAAGSSYADFLGLERTAASHIADPSLLVRRAEALTGARPTIVAVDMPLSRTPIERRRVSDDLVSSAYGARHAGTHTPSALRPGAISDRLRAGFEAAGYPLRTSAPVTDGLIEVYPHPALIELLRAVRRLPYKEGKMRKYWPELGPADRRARLVAQWSDIVAALEDEIDGVVTALPLPDLVAPRHQLKAFEDMLDAVVSAWVGICVLEGRAVSFGDGDSAIWIPTDISDARPSL